MAMKLRALPPGVVEIWYAFPGQNACQLRAHRYLSMLDEEERMRHASFRFDVHRHLYLVSHALLRSVLSLYRDIAPAQWRFETGHYGRPEIATPAEGPRLRFSLSHTEGLAACAVGVDAGIGLDVEALDRRFSLASVIGRVLSELERRDVMERDGDARMERFFTYWTLKEAYLKAVGAESPLPLRAFHFLIDGDYAPEIGFDRPIRDVGDHWHFYRFKPSDRHCLALAASFPATGATCRTFEYAP